MIAQNVTTKNTNKQDGVTNMTKNHNDVDSLDGDPELYYQPNNTIHYGCDYIHLDNGKSYMAMDQCKIKLPGGNWIEGVIYHESDQDKYHILYVRSYDNFLERMVLVK